VMSFNTLSAQQEAFDLEPGGRFGSVWQKGAGLSADSDGYVYADTGEGGMVDGVDLGITVFKLGQSGSQLSLADWFTPWNWSYLSANDVDINNAVVILPDQSGPVPHEAITLGKEGTIYVLNRDNMGQLCSTCNGSDTQIVQELLKVATMGFTPVVWNGSVYITGSSKLQIYTLNNGLLTPSISSTIGSTHPVITSNGTSNGIIWLMNGNHLSALNALSLDVLYTSNQAANERDTLPPYAHFGSPIAADGEVFVGTLDSLVVYGLFPVVKEPSNLSASVNPSSVNQAESFTVMATVPGVAGSPAATGTVSFNAVGGSSSSSGTASLTNGSASYTFANVFPVGTVSVAVSYSGDSVYAPANATIAVADTVPFSVSGTAVTIAAPGATTGNTSTVTVAPVNGFTGAVYLSCVLSTSPAGAQYPPSCSIPASVNITGTSGATATMTIASTSPTSAALVFSWPNRMPWPNRMLWLAADGGGVLAGIFLLGIPARSRKRRVLLSLIVVLVLLGSFIGCGSESNNGGGGGTPGTTPGSYTFTATGSFTATPGASEPVTTTVSVTIN